MRNVYESLKKQKEEERANIGVPQKNSVRNLKIKAGNTSKGSTRPGTAKKPDLTKKKPPVAPGKTHVDQGGWNHDTRTTGQFDSLRKNALKKQEETFERKINPGSSQRQDKQKDPLATALNMEFKKGPEAKIYYSDIDQVHKNLEAADDQNMKLATGNKILQM